MAAESVVRASSPFVEHPLPLSWRSEHLTSERPLRGFQPNRPEEVGQVAKGVAVTQRLLVRTPSRTPQLPHSSVHQCGYSDQAAAKDALAGSAVLFKVRSQRAPIDWISIVRSSTPPPKCVTSCTPLSPLRLAPQSSCLRGPLRLRGTSKRPAWSARSWETGSISTCGGAGPGRRRNLRLAGSGRRLRGARRPPLPSSSIPASTSAGLTTSPARRRC